VSEVLLLVVKAAIKKFLVHKNIFKQVQIAIINFSSRDFTRGLALKNILTTSRFCLLLMTHILSHQSQNSSNLFVI
jgi:hypothetical protein